MKLTHIELLEKLSEDQQLMKLTFDGGKDTAYIIWNHTNLVEHLNEEVIATFRQDIYNGTVCKFINTLASVSTVKTLEREDNVKLYVDVTDNHCNIRFADIEDGQTAQAAVVYVSDIRFDSSARAEWADLTVMDQARKIAQMRIFSPDNRSADLKGRYIQCDIRRNKYGLSTDSVLTIDSAFPYSPEVYIGERFLQSAFAEDKSMLELLASTKFTEFAKRKVDMEPGYTLVRLAVELDLANELSNLIRDVDVTLIKRCLFLEKFGLLQSQSPYREDIVTFAMVSRYEFPGVRDVLHTLYSDDPKFVVERTLVHQVKAFASTVIDAKKGLIK